MRRLIYITIFFILFALPVSMNAQVVMPDSIHTYYGINAFEYLEQKHRADSLRQEVMSCEIDITALNERLEECDSSVFIDIIWKWEMTSLYWRDEYLALKDSVDAQMFPLQYITEGEGHGTSPNEYILWLEWNQYWTLDINNAKVEVHSSLYGDPYNMDIDPKKDWRYLVIHMELDSTDYDSTYMEMCPVVPDRGE